MRRSSIFMLIAAVMLGLVAVLFARSFVVKAPSGPSAPAIRTVAAVVATADIPFGQKITPDKVKVVDFPADTLPAGTFQRIQDLATDDGRVAMRQISANELVTVTAVSDKSNRLSTAKLLNANMRAVSVPLTEVTGVSGMVFPGDMVDVFVTQSPEDSKAYAELLAQSVRVLSVGQDMNVGKDKPEVVKSAVIEVTPLQAQKIALGQQVGQIMVALRKFNDEGRVRLETLQITDLNDGTVSRLVRKRNNDGGGSTNTNSNQGGGKPVPTGPTVQVVRGSEATVVPVLGR
jgi:pilus assembly protein CpaB